MVSFELGHERGTRKKIFLYFLTELKTNHLSYSNYKHDAINIADPSSRQNASYMNFVMTSLTIESLWVSGRASERGIRQSEVQFLMGTQNFLLVPRSLQDEKHLSLLTVYFAQ